jgi:hypothetical protein
MPSTLSRGLAALATAALLAPAVAGAQDPGAPPDPNAPPVSATLTAPSSITKAKLGKGMTVTVRCDLACNARLMLAGRPGIITTKSGQVPAGGTKTFKIKAIALYTKVLKKGDKITLSLDARTDAGALDQASKKIRISG